MWSRSVRRLRWLLTGGLFVGAAVAALSLLTLRGSAGLSQSPLDDFKSLSTAQLEELQVKLTWGGPQEKSVASVGFSSSVGTFDVSAFGPFERRPVSFYINDPDPLPPECSASTSELASMISDVNALPITDLNGFGLDMSEGVLSFMLLTSQTGNPTKDMAFEAVLDGPTAEALLLIIARAVTPCVDPLRTLWLSVGMPIDYDRDGCADGDELGAMEIRGGRRDPLNPWDYFNPANNATNRVKDIIAVVQKFGHDQGVFQDYDTRYDRTELVGGNPWQFGPPNGTIRVFDITAAVRSFGHDCA